MFKWNRVLIEITLRHRSAVDACHWPTNKTTTKMSKCLRTHTSIVYTYNTHIHFIADNNN